MNYNVKSIKVFEKQFKKLYKKYPSLKSDLIKLVSSLKVDPFYGTSLGNNCYKIRMTISSKRKGKSGGARIITNIKISETNVYLLTIYDKKDKETISNKELSELLQQIS
jgi:mRNA-degrading endonuclease RelE of RelBE toxin-antitoxin system